MAIGGTLSKVWALVIVYFMCIFVFANIGQILFTQILEIEPEGDDAPNLRWTSFETAFTSCELLFVLSTGDAWEDTMAAMHVNYSGDNWDGSFSVS
mmetsp:Transcript_37534/g.101738  ORF Transcript_37534/g.101738 Transcript_37534/m.101738 type:complete len:96 (-) Transcript_37534:718-1005(-)